MRVLASSVLAMEFFVMLFAVLIARLDQNGSAILFGAFLTVAFLITPGLLKWRAGWIFGSVLQLLMIGYAFVVPAMAIVGVIFGALWIAAIVVGRKGEAARAALMAAGSPNP